MVTAFGLTHRPFRPSPDPEAYYPATAHEAALDRLLGAFADDESLALLVGEPGTGKTLVGLQLLARLGDCVRPVMLTHGGLDTPGELYQSVLFDLGKPYVGLSEHECRLAVIDDCLAHFAGGGLTLILADEAHLYAPAVLDELRTLTNLSGPGGRAVRVLLTGLPGLVDTLRRPDLLAADQRIAARAWLEPLDPEEAVAYVAHQVRSAGGRPERVFSAEALDIVARASLGFPRLLNQLGHACLKVAGECEARQIDAEVALEVLARFGLPAPDETEDAPSRLAA